MTAPQLIDRTWRFQAFTDYGADARFEVLRETRKVYDDGDHKQVRSSTVSRTIAEISAQPIPGGPVTCTTRGDIVALIARTCHELAAEDDVRAADALAASQKTAP